MTNSSTSSHSSRLLVGFDGSPLAELALEQAAWMAAEAGATIHVVHVIALRERIADDLVRDTAERLRASAASALRTVTAGSGVRVFAHVVGGEPAEQILSIAEDIDAALIVVGTHGRRGIKRLLMGSVAERVVRDASCPVLVMRRNAYHAHPALAPEPPCPDCVDVREATGGSEWWCEPHRKAWIPAHRYSYRDGDLHPYHPDGIGP